MTYEQSEGNEEPPGREELSALRRALLDALEHPMPEAQLLQLMRTVKIQCHKRLAVQAANELKQNGKVDELTQSVLDWGRFTMQEIGIGSLAREIEVKAGLPTP